MDKVHLRSGSEKPPVDTSGATVHVVDDDTHVLESVGGLVRSAGWVPILHPDVDEFLQRFEPASICCVVLDVNMPGATGLSHLRALREAHPRTQVVIVSGYGDIPLALEALRLGARDFIEKPFHPKQLAEQLCRALEADEIERARWARFLEIEEMIARLTPREFQVMGLLSQGVTAKEAAFQLGLSPKTVHVHRSRLLSRVRVDSVVELAILVGEYEQLAARCGEVPGDRLVQGRRRTSSRR